MYSCWSLKWNFPAFQLNTWTWRKSVYSSILFISLFTLRDNRRARAASPHCVHLTPPQKLRSCVRFQYTIAQQSLEKHENHELMPISERANITSTRAWKFQMFRYDNELFLWRGQLRHHTNGAEVFDAHVIRAKVTADESLSKSLLPRRTPLPVEGGW